MKTYFYFIACIIVFPLFAQQKLQIIDKSTDFPVSHVEIKNEQNQVITNSNDDGYFTLPNDVDYILIEHPGYPPQGFSLPTNQNIIFLDSNLVNLKNITIVANDDKSLDLIKKVIENQKKNSPTELDSYKFESYTKFTVDANKDSIPYINNPRNKKDSLQNKTKKQLEKSMFFISERAINHYYDKKYGKKNMVEAARISGLQTPLYEVIALQPLSYEFDQDYFNFFFRKFPNPISKVGMRSFNFSIVDTIQFNDRNYIEIHFNSKSKEKKSLHGYLLIEKDSYALAKFFAENEMSSGSDTYIEVVYKPYEKVWIPSHQVFKLESDNFGYSLPQDSITAKGDTIRKRGTTTSWMNSRTIFSDFTSPATTQKKVYKGYENQVDKQAFKNFKQTIPDFRTDSLSARERMTYVKLDSIGKAEKFDRDIKLLRIITQQGWLSLGFVDLNLLDVIEFNDYEDYRLGINLKTNASLSERFGLNVRSFYGTTDKVIKYGIGGWVNVNPDTNAQFFVDYADDITSSGRFKNPTADFRRTYDFKAEQSSNYQYVDQVKSMVGYRQDLFHKVNFELSLNLAEEKSLFDYRFQNNAIDKKYQDNFIRAAFRYAPKEKHIQTPLGKFTYRRGLPNYYLMVDHGVGMLDGDMEYTRLQLMTRQQIRIFNSPTILNFRTGKVFGDVPIWQYFDGPGKAKNKTRFWQRARFGGSQIFETMAQGEVISDQYVYASVEQKIGNIKFNKSFSIPYNIIYKAGYGTFDKKENHHGFDFQEMDQVYQEVGLEFKDILLDILGIGFYYRLGAYNQDDFATDFSVKAILNFSIM